MVYDENIFPLVISLVILITFTLDDLLMLLGEIDVGHSWDLNGYRLQNSRFFFSKLVKKSVKRGVRVLLSVFSLAPDLLFDC